MPGIVTSSQDGARLEALGERETGRSVGRRARRVALAHEKPTHQIALHLVVVDDEDDLAPGGIIAMLRRGLGFRRLDPPRAAQRR